MTRFQKTFISGQSGSFTKGNCYTFGFIYHLIWANAFKGTSFTESFSVKNIETYSFKNNIIQSQRESFLKGF